MPAAARVGDPTSHPGTISGPGVATVLIASQPASVVGDVHACSYPGTPQHPPNAMVAGSSTVMVGGLPAVRVGDSTACGASVISGAWTVEIGG